MKLIIPFHFKFILSKIIDEKLIIIDRIFLHFHGTILILKKNISVLIE